MLMFSPIVISGPSGSGKDTVVKALLQKRNDIHDAVGYTTRKKRDNEIDGVDINITSKENFEELIKLGKLIEYAEYAGNYYGMPFSEVEKASSQLMLFNVGVSAAKVIKEYNSETITILLLPPSKEELIRRLGERGKERLLQVKKDILFAVSFFDYLVLSETDRVDKATVDIEMIIQKNADEFRLKNHLNFINCFLSEF